MRVIISCCILIAALSGLSGCGGGDSSVKSEISTTTKGQQLLDLQKAYESGAISKEQYEEQKEKVLDK
jgi:hypothetical protein